MAPDLNLHSLLQVLPPHAVHHTSHPQVFKVKAGIMFLYDEELERRKVQFVEKLIERLPYVLVWLKSPQEEAPQDVAPQSLGTAVWTSGEAGFWNLSSSIPVCQLLDELYEGGWGMFFLERPPEGPLSVPEFLQTEPEQILALLRATHAKAVIVSWYDDVEWYYAFESEEIVREPFRDTHK